MPNICSFEKSSRPSPDHVMDQEVLLRIVFHPLHYDKKKNELRPGFIRMKDLHLNGISTDRHEHASLEQICYFIELIRSNLNAVKDVEFIGISSTRTISVRTAKDNGKSLFCVCATPQDNRKSHADIFAFYVDASNFQRLRDILLHCFAPPKDLESFFPQQAK